MCIRDRYETIRYANSVDQVVKISLDYAKVRGLFFIFIITIPVSYTHLRAHETVLDLVCRLLLEKKQQLSNTMANENRRDYVLDGDNTTQVEITNVDKKER